MSTAADEQHSTIRFTTLKADFKIQPYLPVHFLLLISQTNIFFNCDQLHSVNDMTLSDLALYRYVSLNDGDVLKNASLGDFVIVRTS